MVENMDLNALITQIPTLALLMVILVSIILVSKGADWMIDGVVDLAMRTGMPKVIIGATVISLGTTMPETFVSVMAAFMGNPGLALGNGVGSIIADTGLIFGLTCMLSVVPVNRYILDRTGWVQAGAATLLVVISSLALIATNKEPVLNRWVGIFFLVLLFAYLYASYYWAKRSGNEGTDNENDSSDKDLLGLGKCWVMIIGGLFMVIAGARALVPSASEIAFRFGVPEDVIAATMVAFGTSLPELMTAIAAVLKGHPEIAVGNVVGADVLNCLFVIGASATARPLAVPHTFYAFHFPVMLIILYSFRFFIFMNKDNVFKKWQGAWLLSIYLIYIILQYALDFNLEAH